MDTEQLRRYARLIAVTGGGIRPGQSVVLRAGLDQPEFALMLAEKPPLCLEYVVAHELAHLRIHGHGPDFHALLSGVFPREREARALLKA